MSSQDKSNMNSEQNINPLYMATSRSENSTLNRLNSPSSSNSPRSLTSQNFYNKAKPNQLSTRNLQSSQDSISNSLEQDLLCQKRNNLLAKTKNVHIFNFANCDEKIIFCIDVSDEFQSSTIVNGSFVGFIKRFLAFFGAIRKLIKTTDEFALILLTEEVVWLCDFTNDIGVVIRSLDEIDKCNTAECDLNKIFEILIEQIKCLANPVAIVNNAPRCIYRVILLYARSNVIPSLNIKRYGNLLRLVNMFVDVIYIHQPINSENFNQINEIYNQLCELDQRGVSYIFHLSHNEARIHEYLVKMASHPLQRPSQGLEDQQNEASNLDAD